MKQKLLSKLLALAMVLTLLPAGVFAEGTGNTNVAEVDGTKYPTLAAAVDAATDGQTVKLVANTEEDITIPTGKNITLDLGNSTLTNKSGDTITVALGATLTVTGNGESADEDGSAGTVDNITNGKADIVNNGTVILNGGWYLRSLEDGAGPKKPGTNSYYNILNHGEMTINNETVVMQAGKYSSLIVNGYYDYNGDKNKGERNQYIEGTNQAAPKLTINDGAFLGGVNTIKNDDGGELIINGGGFGNEEGCVVMNNNTATINGGRFIATGNYVLYSVHFNDTVNTGKLTVTDGEFEGNLAQISNAPIAISGGTFTADPTAYLADGYMSPKVGDSYKVGLETDAVAQIGNNKYTTLQDAFVAATKGDTVKLLTDVHTNNSTDSYGACLTIRVPITLDLNEHTIYSPDNMGDNEKNFVALNVAADTTLKATTGGIDTGKNGGYAIDVYKGAKLTIDGGKYYGGGTAVQVQKGELTINDGYFDAEAFSSSYGYDFIINCIDSAYKDGTAKVAIQGGYFAHFDPANNKAEGAGTNFVKDGYVSVTSDKSGYDYKVVQKTDTGSIVVKPAVADPEVKVSDSISEKDKQKVEDAAKSVDVPTLGAAAGDKVAAMSKTDAESLVAKAQGLNDPTLYVQSALKVEPTAYSAENKTLTLEITPQYRIVASTAATADDIQLGDTGKNAEVVQAYQNLTITAPTVVTMELPTGFAADGDKLSIKHIKDNGTVEYYTGKVTANGGKLYLTFTTNGFSPFVISAPAASIGENVYPTLQAAVDAVSNDQKIKILKDNETAVVNRTVKFTVDPNGMKYTITLGANCTDKDETENVFDVVYTAPDYAPITKKDVKFDDVDVNAYYAPAVKWAVENKITAGKTDKLFAPDDTCTRGEMITFLWNAAGKPAAKNTTNPFTDVNAGAFYYDAVLWAVSNGITSGTSDTTFSPDNTVSRAQVVAFLYNYANKPAAANSTFTDVAADAYYAPAIGWAAAQKITSGTGNNTFSPENDCTRAQIVTFLYNDLAK